MRECVNGKCEVERGHEKTVSELCKDIEALKVQIREEKNSGKRVCYEAEVKRLVHRLVKKRMRQLKNR